MNQSGLMTLADIHAFGVEILFKQLEKDGWVIEWADALADIRQSPQLCASKDGRTAYFVVRTDTYPNRGRFDEGQDVFDRLVKDAAEKNADCYFASIGIANAAGTSDEEMSVPCKGAPFHIEFDGLIKMELPPGG